MEKKIVGYARVNLPERAESAPALERQVERLKEQGATEIFADISSGTAEERSQFSLMMASIHRGEVQEVVVTRVDRLTRSLGQLSQFIEVFDGSGVNLRILDQQLDLKTSTGKLVSCLLGMMTERERELTNEKLEGLS